MVAVRYWSCCNNESRYLIFRTWDVKPPNNQRGCLTSLIPINKLPPPTPPYTGGGLITKRFPLLCKEGVIVFFERNYGICGWPSGKTWKMSVGSCCFVFCPIWMSGLK
jgi:hypothetical protein